MPVYVISDVIEKDADAFQNYRTKAATSIESFGGRYLARGGSVEALEGNWIPKTLVIVEFPDIDQARAWYRSAEYAQALEYRDAALTRDLILVEGFEKQT